jgi:hypothetical protein
MRLRGVVRKEHGVRGVSGCAWNSTESEVCPDVHGTVWSPRCVQT